MTTATPAAARRVDTDVAQYSTFLVAGHLYGFDVRRVEEVVRPMPMTPVPLAGRHVRGLINLRGQVATAIGLREMFGMTTEPGRTAMNVVCKCEGALIAFLVDDVGDVIEVRRGDLDPTPATMDASVRRFMRGVHKLSDRLLGILDLDDIMKSLNDGSLGKR
jgi:purine-binding chemotaxis protein CheW